jgi:hypothetical protein
MKPKRLKAARTPKLAAAMIFAAIALSGCVDHYCGPAYPNRTDPYCWESHWPPGPIAALDGDDTHVMVG